MVSLRLVAIALAACKAVTAQIELPEGLEVEDVQEIGDELGDESKLQSAPLAVEIKTTFPDSDHIFGIKLVNGRSTKAVLDVNNNEPAPVSLAIVGGSLITLQDKPNAAASHVAQNLTAQRYNVEVPAGQSESVTYTFSTDMHPQDLRLNLAAVLQNSEGKVFTQVLFNETVSVVEAPFSVFDPQIIFLYLFLAAAFGGTCYFIYTTWITTLFPQKRRGGKGGERAKRSTTGAKKVDPSDQIGVVGADGPAVTSGAKAYDESWIPAEHLKRPEARRVGSGRPKSRQAA